MLDGFGPRGVKFTLGWNRQNSAAVTQEGKQVPYFTKRIARKQNSSPL